MGAPLVAALEVADAAVLELRAHREEDGAHERDGDPEGLQGRERDLCREVVERGEEHL